MTEIAAWIAPIATMIAAMMTAANLGARVTGWGFVVFTLGSVCWATIGVSSGQTNLVATNIFLTLVNAVGIWRWLRREAKYQDGGQAAAAKSARADAPALFPASSISGLPVTAASGEAIGRCVEALIRCDDGGVSYVVVGRSNAVGLDEQLRAVTRDQCRFLRDGVQLAMTAAAFEQLPVLPDRDWPARVEA